MARADDRRKRASLLEQAAAAAADAWPAIELDPARFAAHLERHLPSDATPEVVDRWYVGNLYLACACGEGVRAAVLEFESEYMRRVPAYLARMKDAMPLLDDIRQDVREKLLVGSGPANRRILDYTGQAPLGAWLKVVVVNLAVSMLRRKSPENSADECETEAIARPGDPELDYAKVRHRADFEQAFRDAMATLEIRERNVLRLHFLDGLNIEAIGSMHGVHRATVARWIAATRAKLFDETRRLLRERLHLTEAEADSLAAALQSRLEVTLRGLL